MFFSSRATQKIKYPTPYINNVLQKSTLLRECYISRPCWLARISKVSAYSILLFSSKPSYFLCNTLSFFTVLFSITFDTLYECLRCTDSKPVFYVGK